MTAIMNLADPELELIDPTPNVHSMFLHFDRTFFWAKLASRAVVRWSKRMYSCAGICSYEGRGGLCDIALSEPLLKLRPRKDLVETLLHEMIHAYLFITCRDQNRDGHGPNFQAHMHRINRAAGLNISIYHDFHDEVKLYRTHWWRCNGPCQKMRPYFGTVRRTNNRAPGPSDFWWKDHMRKCGGTFIKIKEPEKPQKASKKDKVSKSNGDITKYVNNNNDKEVPNKNLIKNDILTPVLKDSSNIPKKSNVGIKSNSSSTVVITKKNVVFNPQLPKAPVVFSGKGQTVSGERKRTTSENVLETVRNVWANKQLGTNSNNKSKDTTKSDSRTNAQTNLSKHKAHKPHIDSPPPKMKKIDDYFKTTASTMLKDLYGQDFSITQSKKDQKLIAVPKEINLVDCPICNSKVNSSEINNHLDECLNKDTIEKISKDRIVVKKESDVKTIKSDKIKLKEIVGTVPPIPNYTNNIKTVVKEENISPNDSKIKQEIIQGIINLYDAFTDNKNKNDIKINKQRTSFDQHAIHTSKVKTDMANLIKVRKSDSFKESKVEKVTDIGTKPINGDKLKATDQKIKVEPGCSKDRDLPSETECPCCSVKINTSIDEHLDECLSFFDNSSTISEEGASTSYATETIVLDDDDDEFDESQTLNATGTKLPCPCCLQMVEEIDMNNHLDKCLS